MIRALEGHNLTLFGTEANTPIAAKKPKSSTSSAIQTHKPFSQIAKITPTEQDPFSASVKKPIRLVFDSNLNMVHTVSLRDQPNEKLEIDLSRIRSISGKRHCAAATARVIVDIIRKEDGSGYTLRAKIDVANNDGDPSWNKRYTDECSSFSRYKVDASSAAARGIGDDHVTFILTSQAKIRELTVAKPDDTHGDDGDDERITIKRCRTEQPTADDYVLRYREYYHLKDVDDQLTIRRSHDETPPPSLEEFDDQTPPPSFEEFLEISSRQDPESTLV